MENNIDVPKMKTAIHEYHRMQRDMADFQERQKELESRRDAQLLRLKQHMSAWKRRLSESAGRAAGVELDREKTLALMQIFSQGAAGFAGFPPK